MPKVQRRLGGKSVNRRPNGSGSVSLRPDGAYDVRVSLPAGKRRRRIVRSRPGETQVQHRRRAEAAATELLSEVAAGLTVPSGHTSVADYGAFWLDRERVKSLAGRGLAPATIAFYSQQLEYYINPWVGTRPLPALTVVDVELMVDGLVAAGRSHRTVQAARNALGRVLRAAKRDGLIVKVATDDASRLRRTIADDEDATSKALPPEEVRRLFDTAAGTPWEPIVAVLAYLGVRRGEALGLSWADVDFDAATVRIRRSLSRVSLVEGTRLMLAPTKTRSSRRLLHLDPSLVSVLRRWRAEQALERAAAGAHWGRGWADEELVFTTPRGTPVDPDNLRRAIGRLGLEAGIGHVHPHQLRHSVASLLIADGHSVPEVSKVLGHSSPSVTLAYYAAAFDKASVGALGTVAGALTRCEPAGESDAVSGQTADLPRAGDGGYL